MISSIINPLQRNKTTKRNILKILIQNFILNTKLSCLQCINWIKIQFKKFKRFKSLLNRIQDLLTPIKDILRNKFLKCNNSNKPCNLFKSKISQKSRIIIFRLILTKILINENRFWIRMERAPMSLLILKINYLRVKQTKIIMQIQILTRKSILQI